MSVIKVAAYFGLLGLTLYIAGEIASAIKEEIKSEVV